MRNVSRLLLVLLSFGIAAFAQESPYFITYTHHMEEPGSLEIATNPVVGRSPGLNSFIGNSTEFEYGTKAWWTSEFYLDTQKTLHDSSLFTGYRVENRFRLLMKEHRINPVLYVEYEHVNGADKTLREIVGFDGKESQGEPNQTARRETESEIETKLILSSQLNSWNVAVNLIGAKNLHEGVWEFGYTMGAYRPFRLAAGPDRCVFCRENLSAGIEIYGGLGDWNSIRVGGTSQYVAPVIAWNLPSGTSLRFSPGFGATEQSHGTLLRFGVSHEISGFGSQIKSLLHGGAK